MLRVVAMINVACGRSGRWVMYEHVLFSIKTVVKLYHIIFHCDRCLKADLSITSQWVAKKKTYLRNQPSPVQPHT